MTGIERLRTLAGEWDAYGLGGTLGDIADQIERERACDADTIENIRLIVGVVIDDMERHCLGHEGMEDSPVARWARELRGALKSDASDGSEAQNPSCVDAAEAADVTSEAQKVTRDPAEDVSMSAYDLLPSDERDAIAWVREHGGIEAVKEEWNHSRNLKRSLETAQAKVERQQRHIEFVQRKCRERQEHIVELNKSHTYRYADEEERPAKVLDADGAEIRVGDVLYRKSDGHMVKVAEVYEKTFTDADDYVRPGDGFTHRAPVFAADVRPLHEGEHVYHVETGAELVVKELPKPGEYQAVVVFAPPASHPTSFDPDQLTHQRPDTWQRIEEDAGCTATKYNERRGTIFTTKQQVARDIVRRCRALAERERGE